MIKTFHIFLDIDTDKPGDSGAHTEYNDKNEPLRTLVEIRGDTEGFDAASIAAHEIGHALAQVFETPGYRNSPDYDLGASITNSILGYSPVDMPALVAEEKEAWELAEMMIPIDKKTKDFGLGGYVEIAEGKGNE